VPVAPDTPATLAAFVAELSPDVVGVHLKTLEVRRAYDLVAPLASLGVPLIAGGPHATVRPLEPLRHGFDLVVTGEAEDSLPALLDHLDDPGRVDGVSFVDRGIPRHRPRAKASGDLDALPDPHAAPSTRSSPSTTALSARSRRGASCRAGGVRPPAPSAPTT